MSTTSTACRTLTELDPAGAVNIAVDVRDDDTTWVLLEDLQMWLLAMEVARPAPELCGDFEAGVDAGLSTVRESLDATGLEVEARYAELKAICRASPPRPERAPNRNVSTPRRRKAEQLALWGDGS
jgi:hypothetical protein